MIRVSVDFLCTL